MARRLLYGAHSFIRSLMLRLTEALSFAIALRLFPQDPFLLLDLKGISGREKI